MQFRSSRKRDMEGAIKLVVAQSIDKPAEGPGLMYQRLVESVSAYAIYMLSPDGIVSSWSLGAQRFKGYTASEIIGSHFSKFYTAADRAVSKPENALATAQRDNRFEEKAWRVRKDGSAFWAYVIIDLILSEQGEPIGFAKITRDITERRETETRVHALSESNREHEQFVHVASHDLREPLRKVLAFSDLLMTKEGHKVSQDAVGYLASITAATRRMQALLDSLRRLSRIATNGGDFVRSNLNALFREVQSDLALAISETSAQIECDELPEIEADPFQMRQLFQNFLGNSSKYIHKDERLHIVVRHMPVRSKAVIAIAFSDNGIVLIPSTTSVFSACSNDCKHETNTRAPVLVYQSARKYVTDIAEKFTLPPNPAVAQRSPSASQLFTTPNKARHEPGHHHGAG